MLVHGAGPMLDGGGRDYRFGTIPLRLILCFCPGETRKDGINNLPDVAFLVMQFFMRAARWLCWTEMPGPCRLPTVISKA